MIKTNTQDAHTSIAPVRAKTAEYLAWLEKVKQNRKQKRKQ
jgi:hypothetical protein